MALLHALTVLITAAVIASDWAMPNVPFDTGPDWDLSLSSPEVKGSADADRLAQTVPGAWAGDREMMPDEKMGVDIQSEGGGEERESFRQEWREDRSTRSERVRVIDWIHHQVAILGFNQPSKHRTHAQAKRGMYTHKWEDQEFLLAMFGSESVSGDNATLQNNFPSANKNIV